MSTKKKKIALEVKNVSKSFRLPTEQANGIKQAFINRVRGVKGYTEQRVLKDISFTVEEGDFFGIVGRNGSGKSTLLKLISQIYVPDSGEITVNGKLVPFIELGVGFNPELTGRENVYLNGALLGFSHEEVSDMYEDIVSFAELEDFMDQKLKNYSSGMQVRLAFSIAIKAEGSILVLDEVLAVGDAAFQRKCYEYFGKLRREKRTVILVTHDMESVRQYCNKAILINDGKIVKRGTDINAVADSYLQLFIDDKQDDEPQEQDIEGESGRWGSGDVLVSSIQATLSKSELRAEIVLEAKSDDAEDGLIMALRILDADGSLIAGASTRDMSPSETAMVTGDKRTYDMVIPNVFGREIVYLGYHVVNLSGTLVYDSSDMTVKLSNPGRPSFYSVVFNGAVKTRHD